MGFIGQYQPYYAQILFLGYAAIALLLLAIQIIKLQKLAILPIYLLPCLSLLVCYQNIILYFSDSIRTNSDEAYAGYVFHSFEIPMYVVIIYEVAQRLHEARSAKFLCLVFDEGLKYDSFAAVISVWAVRFLAIGLFVLNILTDFSLLPTSNNSLKTGSGGYIFLAKNPASLSIWLNLIPPIILSATSIILGIVLFR